jgi:alkylhydroperoxidase/carboxymuconolactone decarboxylase family protein YurZ
MAEHPLQVFIKHDPELFKLLEQAREFELADGALPKKDKLLIALALDAAHGAVNGVKSLAKQAMAAGATKEEILEVIHVVHYICGVGSVYTAAQGLNDVL